MNTLDLTNVNCTFRIIKIKQTMEQLSSGDELLLIFKDPSFIIDCKVYTNKTGDHFIANWTKAEFIHCIIQKK